MIEEGFLHIFKYIKVIYAYIRNYFIKFSIKIG